MARMIAVDDERAALGLLEQAVRKAAPRDELVTFMSPKQALEHVKEHGADVAFLDCEMPELDGPQLARAMKFYCPRINIIFVTAYNRYTASALELHASGFVTKPVSEDRIREELEDLRHPIRTPANGIRAVTFGHFELFVNGQEVRFARSKSKEMLAYLIDWKGNLIKRKELAAVLFEDMEYSRSVQSYTSKTIQELERSLKAAGAGELLVKRNLAFGVDCSKFSCDLYEYDEGDPAAYNAFQGEYMTQYSWGERTLARLCNL